MKRQTRQIKDYGDYNNRQYDEMKSLLDKSKKLFEQTTPEPRNNYFG